MIKACYRMGYIISVLLCLFIFSCSQAGTDLSPDLIVSSIVYTETVYESQEWTLGSVIKNIGPGNAGPGTVRYYLSNDDILDAGDTTIGESSIDGIEAGSSISNTYSTTYSIAPAGSYYIFVEADVYDDVIEENEANNIRSAGIIVNPAPDLTISSITIPGILQNKTDTWTLAATVANSSAIDAGASTLKYYLSKDNVLDASDTLINASGTAIPAIAAGSSYADTYSDSYFIPQSGRHYIIVVADSENQVPESNEGNNSDSAIVDIIFERIVIETFSPTGKWDYSTDTYLVLFDSNGDPANDESAAIASNESGNPNHMWYSYIDNTGLAPGTYYIKVRGRVSTQTGPYGLRVLSLAVGDPIPAYSYFDNTNPTSEPWNDSYESDDSMTGGIPDNPQPITLETPPDGYNRSLSEADIDWFKFRLD